MKTLNVLIVDGQGGGIGRQLVEEIKNARLPCRVTAVGTNTAATGAMLKAGAEQGATGENAVVVACRRAEVIVGPLGIALADALMGEITPAMAHAVTASDADRILIPMNLCQTYVAGVSRSSSAILEDAAARIRQLRDEKQSQ